MIDSAALRAYCLKKPGTTEDTPFDEVTLVFRVMNKMYALLDTEGVPTTVNLKCDPERAIELRERYDAVQPGYHQNKKHWNTVTLDASISDGEIRGMIDHSYELVVAGLSRAERERVSKVRG